MTYKKSSTDFAVKNDFRQCLKSHFVFPLLALIYLTGRLVLTITDVYFNGDTPYDYMLFQRSNLFSTTIVELALVMCFAGVLTAVKSFAFLRKVSSTNVYLSLPITRNDLLKNRIKCAAFYFGVATVFPMLVAIMLNFVFFRPNMYFVGICFLISACLFITAMLCFAIASAVTIAVGRIGEAVFFSTIIIDAPSVIITLLPKLATTYINGASISNSNNHYSLLQRFATDYSSEYYWLKPLSFFNRIEDYFYLKRGEEYVKLGFDIVGPMIFMAVVAIAIFAISFVVFKNRKAEIAGVVGANKPLVVGTGIYAGFVLFCAINLTNYIGRVVAGVVALIIALMAYLAVTMILYRSKKNIIKNFKVVPYFAGSLAIILIVCLTGIFGYYNRVPEVKDVDFAYAVASASDGYMTSNSGGDSIMSAYNHDTVVGRIDDEQDLNSLVDIHKSVVDNLGDGNGTFKVVYVMKDGSVIVRGYYEVGEKAERETMKIYNTKAYKDFITLGFTTSNAQIIRQLDAVSTGWQNNHENFTKIDGAEYDIQTTRFYKLETMSREDEFFLADRTQTNSINLTDTISDAQIKELKACMAQDIINLDIEKLILSGEDAVYYFGTMENKDAVYYDVDEKAFDVSRLDSLADFEYKDCYPIYPSMTRTIAYINSLNLNIPEFDTELIKSVKFIDAGERYDTSSPFDYYNPINKDRSFYTFALSNDALDYYYYMYGENYFRYNGYKFDNGTESTDRNLIGWLYNHSYNNYKFLEDKGKIVLFTLEDGTIFTGYVPEEHVPFEIK